MAEIEDLIAALAATGELKLKVKVNPKSSRNQVLGKMEDGTLRIKVAAPPEKGKANAELCRFLAEQLGVPKGNVSVESGHTSHLKRVSVRR
jgi:uncharacterized protein (TIGR00251 family)